MGRQQKVIRGDDGGDRRELGYYSTPDFVVEFLASRLLSLRPLARSVMDPCVGKGEMIAPYAKAGLHVSGIDIVDRHPDGCSDLTIADFLELAAPKNSTLFSRALLPKTDIIVANPPYNCHETDYIRINKPKLVAAFGKSTALNMYSLFLKAIVDVAEEDCLIGLVVHDSFLTAIGHTELRRYILSECNLLDLHLCPTTLFADQRADVRTCLMVLEKKQSTSFSRVRVSNRVASVQEFEANLASNDFDSRPLMELILSGKADNDEIVVGVPTPIYSLFNERRLSDIVPCVTGISTGNDSKYLSLHAKSGCSIPFYKNPASRKFYAAPDGYIVDNYLEVAETVPNFMVRNKDLLLRGGLSCSSMGVAFGATIRPEGTLCGVNPNLIVDDERKWWLLAYLNSRLCFYLLRGVIIRGNMVTAGYASRIPVPSFDHETISKLAFWGRESFNKALADKDCAPEKAMIDVIIEDKLGIDDSVRDFLGSFQAGAVKLA